MKNGDRCYSFPSQSSLSLQHCWHHSALSPLFLSKVDLKWNIDYFYPHSFSFRNRVFLSNKTFWIEIHFPEWSPVIKSSLDLLFSLHHVSKSWWYSTQYLPQIRSKSTIIITRSRTENPYTSHINYSNLAYSLRHFSRYISPRFERFSTHLFLYIVLTRLWIGKHTVTKLLNSVPKRIKLYAPFFQELDGFSDSSSQNIERVILLLLLKERFVSFCWVHFDRYYSLHLLLRVLGDITQYILLSGPFLKYVSPIHLNIKHYI